MTSKDYPGVDSFITMIKFNLYLYLGTFFTVKDMQSEHDLE